MLLLAMSMALQSRAVFFLICMVELAMAAGLPAAQRQLQ